MAKDPMDQSVCVVGLGYIGLPTASLLATRGYDVFGVDVNDAIVAALKCGALEITEPDLDVLVSSAINSGRLRVGDKPVAADVYI